MNMNSEHGRDYWNIASPAGIKLHSPPVQFSITHNDDLWVSQSNAAHPFKALGVQSSYVPSMINTVRCTTSVKPSTYQVCNDQTVDWEDQVDQLQVETSGKTTVLYR